MFIRVVFLLIFNIYLIEIDAKDLKNDVTTSSTPTSTLQRSTTHEYNSESEGLIKRDLKQTDLSASGKSYEPPPEFYRGPGSTDHLTSTQASSYYNNYKPYNSYKSRPISFPDSYSANNYDKYDETNGGQQDNKNPHLASSYNSWQHLKGKVSTFLNKKDALQDRISVGHYGTSEHGSSANGGYAYGSRPYDSQAHHSAYIPNSPHYGSSVAPSAHATGYYGGSAAAEGVPFDVYGSKNHYSGLAGNEYAAYSYPEDHEAATHKSHPDISHKAILAKSFLIPLASAAVLGIAAALVSNPLLLQLGTVSGVAPGAAVYGKRKRRDLTTSATLNDKSTNSLDFILNSVDKNKKDSKLFPYRGHHQQQKQHRHRHFVPT